VVSFGSSVLRLAPVVKDHYVDFLASSFPDFLARYERAYAGTTISSDYQRAIERRVDRFRDLHGFGEDAMLRQPRLERATEPSRPVLPRGVEQLPLVMH
jgi:hypothetical protein